MSVREMWEGLEKKTQNKNETTIILRAGGKINVDVVRK